MGPHGRYSVGPGIAAAGVVTEIVDKVNRSNYSEHRRWALIAAAHILANSEPPGTYTLDERINRVIFVAEEFAEWLA